MKRRELITVLVYGENVAVVMLWPISPAIGGALIGLSAVLLALFTGRIAGVSGIFAGLINPQTGDRAWRATFIAGLIAAPVIAAL
jgi:hypothetical protein